MELKATDFSGQTLNRQGTVAAVFLASWCPFCRRFQPAFETAAKVSGTLWASVDVSDDHNELWNVFNIEIVPTVLVFKDGKLVWRRDGVLGRGLSEDVIKETIGQMKLLG
jgi:thioredoxin-like negative regulator of GroEL